PGPPRRGRPHGRAPPQLADARRPRLRRAGAGDGERSPGRYADGRRAPGLSRPPSPHRVLSPLLDDEQRALLAGERRVLGEVQDAIVRAGSPDEDVAALRASADQLDHLFLLVVVGEFNAGKSALVSALLGQRLLEEGVTPTTSRVGLVEWGDPPSREVLESGLERRTAR